MSSKGQIVIPEKIRKTLHLTEGNQLVVLGEKDVITLKIITHPSIKDLDHLIAKARSEARKAGLKKTNLKKIIKKTRKE
jgi:AbrB family looped-hinge helix DNA binding protein